MQRPENILESKTDTEEWKLELERVLPQLKVTVKTGDTEDSLKFKEFSLLIEKTIADSRDWRAHLEQMKELRTNIASGLNGTRGQLEKLHIDIGNTLEKIKTREMYMNRQLEPVLNEFRTVQVHAFSFL